MVVATTPQSGVGISLSWKDSSGSTYAVMPQLKDDCGFDGFERTVINITPLASNAAQKAAGRVNYGSFGGTMYYVPSEAGNMKMFSLFAASTTEAWEVTFNDGSTLPTSTTLTFNGFIKSLTPGNFTGEDSPTLTFSIEITGPVTVVAAT